MARGSVVKRGKNWSIVYCLPNRKQKWKTIGPSKKEAEMALREVMGAIDRGEYMELKEINFSDFARVWLRDHAESRVKPSTLKFYQDIIRLHLLPYFGAIQLTAISPHSVERYKTAKRKEGKLSARTIGYHLGLLKSMFKRAIIWGYLRSNPAEYIERPRAEKKEMIILTREELLKFLEEVRQKYHALFLTAAMTGMRRGEILALRWSDINWSRSEIHVRQNYVLGKFQEPKSKSSIRTIPMLSVLAKTLKKHRLSSPSNDLDLVFASKEGTPLYFENIYRREFLPTLRRADLPQIRFHDLRHTYASLLLAQGENIKVVSQILGHASTQTTLNTYAHVIPGTEKEVGTRLQEALFGNPISNLLAEPQKPAS